MFVKYAGCHIHKDVLKAGIAVYPEETDKNYAVQHVYVPVFPEEGYQGEVDELGSPIDIDDYNAWVEGLPHIWVTNPVFNHFIRIDPNITKTALEMKIQEIFTPNVLTSADTFLSTRGKDERADFSRFRKMMASQEKLGDKVYLPKDYDAQLVVAKVNGNLKSVEGKLDSNGRIQDIKPGTIDIGSAATDRAGQGLYSSTWILLDNPANDDGAITSIEIWAYSNMSNCEVATFIDEGSNTYSTRDNETLGSVTSGSKQTFSGLSMDVATGDYLGGYWTAGKIERDYSGYSGVWQEGGDNIPCSSVEFDDFYDGTLSLYGEGEESVAAGMPVFMHHYKQMWRN